MYLFFFSILLREVIDVFDAFTYIFFFLLKAFAPSELSCILRLPENVSQLECGECALHYRAVNQETAALLYWNIE